MTYIQLIGHVLVRVSYVLLVKKVRLTKLCQTALQVGRVRIYNLSFARTFEQQRETGNPSKSVKNDALHINSAMTTALPSPSSNPLDDEPKVILEQTLLRVEEAFVYRIPPMMTSSGHR